MKELLKTKYIIIALSAIVLILSNPSERKYKQKFTSLLMEKVNKDTPTDELNAGAQAIAIGFINSIIDNVVYRNNYILFSTCEVTWLGETKTIGVGALGMVFIYDAAINEVK